MGQASSVLDKIELDQKENFSAATIEKFKSDPEFYRTFVKAIEKELNNTFPMVLLKSPVQAFVRQKVEEYMRAMLGNDEKLCKTLIPDYPVGCRRITPGHSYLQALTKPNVEVKVGGVERFVPEGIQLESGEVVKVDAIVCATGFDTSFRPRFPLVGREGNLQDTWSEGNVPKAYMSCGVANMPNYFGKSALLRQLKDHLVCSHSTPHSLPRSQRPHRPRQRLHSQRAHCQVHYWRNSQVPDRRD